MSKHCKHKCCRCNNVYGNYGYGNYANYGYGNYARFNNNLLLPFLFFPFFF